jgi:multicomponent Na+:H+ antiporter subunit B
MMSVVARTTARVLFPLMLVYSLYAVANGHLTPGGGFQGGAIAGGAFILLSLAMGYGSVHKTFDEVKLSVAESTGSVAYVLTAVAGIAFAGAFFANWLPRGSFGELFSAGFMPLLNCAIALKVAAGFFTIAILFIALNWEEDGID